MTLRSSDLQLDSDLDSIRNSCDVSSSGCRLQILLEEVAPPVMEEALVAVILVRVPDPLAAGSGSGNLTIPSSKSKQKLGARQNIKHAVATMQ